MQSKKASITTIIATCIMIVWAIPVIFPSAVVFATDQTKAYEMQQRAADVADILQNTYVDEVNGEDMWTKGIQGMVSSLDPHSEYMTKEVYQEFKQETTKGEFTGVGLVISREENQVVVVSPIEGTPAFKAGIRTGDIILQVDDTILKGGLTSQASKLMRGPKGTTVKVIILRPSTGEILPISLKRDLISVETIKSALFKPGFGYIWITNFQEKTLKDFKSAMGGFEKNEPLKGLILDLRDNPGGLLDQAINLSDLFVSEGELVSVRGRDKTTKQSFLATQPGTRADIPIVVLINGGSASASEIVAGALQDHKRALLLGTTTFGKGSVQTLHEFSDGSGMKYTIARYYTPSGRSIQAEGIKPDVEVKNRFVKGLGQEVFLKESDLQNHLTAEGKSEDKKETTKASEIKKEALTTVAKPISDEDRKVIKDTQLSRYTGVDPEKLLQDNQINSALEILMGHQVFMEKAK